MDDWQVKKRSHIKLRFLFAIFLVTSH